MHVVIYTNEDCDPCVATKSWLTENGLSEFDERHMKDKTVQQEMVALGYTIYHYTNKDEIIGCGAITIDGIAMTETTLKELGLSPRQGMFYP